MTKQEKYSTILAQVKSLAEGSTWDISLMSNVAAVIHQTMGFWWTGFYLVRDLPHSEPAQQVLMLGPFQGPVACTRIAKGRGVCGTAWAQDQTIVVPDVEEFPGHIACSSASRSEIVVPIRRNSEVIGVLDIDSAELGTFDSEDALWLEQIVSVL